MKKVMLVSGILFLSVISVSAQIVSSDKVPSLSGLNTEPYLPALPAVRIEPASQGNAFSSECECTGARIWTSCGKRYICVDGIRVRNAPTPQQIKILNTNLSGTPADVSDIKTLPYGSVNPRRYE